MIVRVPVRFALLAALLLPPAFAHGEPSWEMVVRDRERGVELDRASVIQSDGGHKVAWARIVLSPERAAVEGYALVKAMNRYDCYNRSFFTLKRVYMDARHVVLREESGLDDSPVLAARNSVDERLWQEVCKPPTVAELKKVARDVTAIADAVNAAPSAPAAALVPLSRSAAAPVDPPARETARIARQVQPPAVEQKPASGPPPVALAPRTVPQPQAARAPAVPRPAAIAPAGVSRPEWSYEGETGPERWGALRPEWALCGEGKRQSPIDLREGIVVDLEPPRFDYRETGFRITDTGRTLRVHVGPGLGVALRGQRYELDFLEFQRPAFDRNGPRASDVTVHLQHRDANGNLAIIVVALEAGERPQPLIQTLWNNLPLERGTSYAPAVTINPAALLPASPAHYLYMGSLETPPCSEGVLWAVMKQPQQLSHEQAGIFARLYPRTGRPIQPTNGRLVLESR